MEILDRSRARAPSCLKQLTVWVNNREAIQFAIDQLDRHHAPWLLKRHGTKVAVFVPGRTESDDE